MSISIFYIHIRWNTSIYQCEVYPVDDGNNFEYLCDDWTVLGQICLAEYKMMIDNSDSEDTPIIDSMIVNTATAFYGISDWCLPDDEVPWGFLDSWESTLNQCSSGYSNYDAICVATTGDRCAPGIIMTYFDGNSPNTFHDTSLWESVSDSTIEYNTCSPTAIPTLRPSVDPTYRPTEDPTEIPTDYPSAIPTKSPTDLPTKRRTQIPTKSPTSDPTKFPSKTPSSVPTENSSADLTQHPTMKPTVPYMIAAQSSTLPAASQSSVMSTTEIPEDASVQSIPYNQSENTSDHLLFIVISAFSAVICILIFVVIRLSRRKTVIAQSKTAQNKELTETVQIRMATDEKAMVTSISLQSIPDVHSSDLSKGADLYPTIENERVIQTLCAMNERVNGFDTTTYGDDSSSSSSALGDMYTTRNALADGIQTIGDDAVVRKGNARLAAPELDRPVSSLSTKENDVKKNESIEFTRNFIQ